VVNEFKWIIRSRFSSETVHRTVRAGIGTLKTILLDEQWNEKEKSYHVCHKSETNAGGIRWWLEEEIVWLTPRIFVSHYVSVSDSLVSNPSMKHREMIFLLVRSQVRQVSQMQESHPVASGESLFKLFNSQNWFLVLNQLLTVTVDFAWLKTSSPWIFHRT